MRLARTCSVRRAAVGGACAGLLLLSACSPEQPAKLSGTEGDAASVITKLGTSARNDDGGTICRDLITPALARELAARAGGSCSNAVARAIRGADFLDVKVEAVTFDGASKDALAATVRATVADTEKRRRTLYVGVTRSDAKSNWQIADFAAPRPVATTTP